MWMTLTVLKEQTTWMSRQPLRQPWLLSRLLHECAVTMGMALECLSITAYNSHLNSYLMFCHIHNCPIYPSVDTLSFFVVFMSAHICLDSVAVYLTGVCNHLAHEFPKVHQHCASPIVKHTLAGCLWCAHQQPICRPPLLWLTFMMLSMLPHWTPPMMTCFSPHFLQQVSICSCVSVSSFGPIPSNSKAIAKSSFAILSSVTMTPIVSPYLHTKPSKLGTETRS